MSNKDAQKFHIPSSPNLRDLGGFVTQDGKRVRSGLISF